MEIDLELLRQVFQTEGEEHVAEMEQALLALESAPQDGGALRTAFRATHTLKGSAAMVGLTGIADLAHSAEELLERMRAGSLLPTRGTVGLALECVDVLRLMLECALDPDAEMSFGQNELRERIADLVHGVASRVARPASESSAEPAASKAATRPIPHAARKEGGATTLRVGTEKLDRLLALASEIVISRAMFQQLLLGVKGSFGERLREVFRESERLVLELQEQVSSVRMVPMGPTLRRYVRVARDLAQSLGKRTRVEIQGEDVEIDAAVVEHLRDPLTQIVRNAVDHGLEMPEVRAERGKDSTGCIRLRASHRAGGIALDCSDDGRGPDRPAILARARANGLTRATTLPDHAIDALVFEDGLSTAAQVTELSGRGVGMSVVRRNIEALGGSVRLHGTPGEGTTVSVWLPLTLAIVEALNVSCAGETFLIPLSCVVECFDLSRRPGEDAGQLARRGRSTPWARLAAVVGAPSVGAASRAVLLQHGTRQAAIAVDDILGTQQIVLKPMHRILRHASALAGCTILNSGKVALVVDAEVVVANVRAAARALGEPAPNEVHA